MPHKLTPAQRQPPNAELKLARALDRALKPLRATLYWRLRQALWQVLPEKAVWVEAGPRGRQRVHIGNLVFTAAPSGALAISTEPPPGCPFTAQADTIRKLTASFHDFHTHVAGALTHLARRATTATIAATGVALDYQDAVRAAVAPLKAAFVAARLEEIRLAITALPRRRAPVRRQADVHGCCRTLEDGPFSYPIESASRHDYGDALTTVLAKRDLRRTTPSGALLADLQAYLTERVDRIVPHVLAERFTAYLTRRLELGAFGITPAWVAKHGLKTLTQVVNREVWDLSWRSSPIARVVHPCRLKGLAKHATLYRQVQADAPSLLKLFGVTFERLMPRDLAARVVADGPRAAVAHLRRFWLDRGITPAGWRLVHNTNPFQREAYLSKLRWLEAEAGDAADPSHEAVVRWAGLLADIAALGEPPPPGFWKAIRSPYEVNAPDGWFREVNRILLRAGLQAVRAERPFDLELRKRAKTPQELKELRTASAHEAPALRFKLQVEDVQDFLRAIARNPYLAPAIPPGATWAWLRNVSERWHEDLFRDQRAQDETYLAQAEQVTWEGAPIFERDGLRAICLANHRLLIEEGETLHHCVSDYVYACRSGHSRIFSVRTLAGKPIATLELARQGKTWVVSQIRGHCNLAPELDLGPFALQLLAAVRPHLPHPQPAKPKKRGAA